MRFSGAITRGGWAVVLLGLTLTLAACYGGDGRAPDRDHDGMADLLDIFPDDPTEWADMDGDRIGDNADPDVDGDDIPNGVDPFPYGPLDSDDDGLGNGGDLDDDNDGWPDAVDAFPLDPNEWMDADSDGIGNNADPQHVVTAEEIAGLATTGVVINNSKDLLVLEPVSWNSTHTLTLSTPGNITIVNTVTGGNGHLVLNAGGHISDISALDVKRFTLQAGDWVQNTANLPAFSANDFSLEGGSFLRVKNGTGVDAAHAYRIIDIYGLQGVDTFLTSSFALANDIDATVTSGWNNGAGFKPIGSDSTPYAGDFDGARYIVNGLQINRPGINNVGLFSALAEGHVIRNIGLAGGTIDAHGIWNGFTGGYTNGTGALVGINRGTVDNSHTDTPVTGYENVGGLVGINFGTVFYGRAEAAVKGRMVFTGDISSDLITGSGIGGLVGENRGTVRYSQAGGAVQGAGPLGGLVGRNLGLISNSYSTASVSGGSTIGGLVGDNSLGNSIEYSYASGALSVSSGMARGIAGMSNIAPGVTPVTHSRWDTDSTGVFYGCADTSNGSSVTCAPYVNDPDTTAWARTTVQMQQIASFGGWGISSDIGSHSIWYIAEGASRPRLRLVADIDSDGDGVNNPDDAFPFNASESTDLDGDGVGDQSDAYPDDPREVLDTDGDGAGDNADLDDDNDSVADAADPFPRDADEWADSDNDGHGDNSDVFPQDTTEWADVNNDGIGDNSEALVEPATVPEGDSHCPYGGSVVRYGLDGNGDRLLQTGEIDDSKTTYSCNPPVFAISGTVTGLPADGSEALTLGNGHSNIVVTQDGSFSFPKLATGSNWQIGIPVKPSTRYCEQVAGDSSGTIAGAAVGGISIVCHEYGEVVTLAGSGSPGLFGGYYDAAGSSAQFDNPLGIAFNPSGTLYVADWGNNRIRTVSPANVVATFAAGVTFNRPRSVAVDKNGNVYVADTDNGRVVKLNPAGDTVLTTWTHCSGDGSYPLLAPVGVAVDTAGGVYVAVNPALNVADPDRNSKNNGFICKVNTSTRLAIDLGDVEALAVDPTGQRVYVSESSNVAGNPTATYENRVVMVSVQGAYSDNTVVTLAGSADGTLGSANGTGAAARFYNPAGLALDANGLLYVADASNGCIRKISPAGAVSTLAGSCTNPGYVDGVGAAAKFAIPKGVAVDAQGNVYVGDSYNQRIRKIYQTKSGGNGGSALPVNPAPLTAQQLQDSFNNDGMAQFLFSLLKQNWDSAQFGGLPDDSSLLDAAVTFCRVTEGCATTGDAILNLFNQMQADSAVYALVAAWADLHRSPGWGATSGMSFTPGTPTCTGWESGTISCTAPASFTYFALCPGSSPIPAEIKQNAWKSATAAGTLVHTAHLIQALLGALQPGDPGYGTTLADALRNLGSECNAISRGYEAVLLMTQAATLLEMQRSGLTLSAAQQTFATQVASQMLTQAKSVLTRLRTDFDAYQEANRPDGMNMSTLFYWGVAPTDEMRNTLVSLIPQSSPSAIANDTATTAMRLMMAIGQSQQAEASGSSGPSAALTAVTVASPLIAAGGGALGGGAVSLSTAAVTAFAKVVTPFALRAGALASPITGVVSTIAGPAAIVAAAVISIITGALQVADIDVFTNSMTLTGAILDQLSLNASLLQLNMMFIPVKLCVQGDNCSAVISVGSVEQMQWAIINLVHH